jgi:hypothetical protein
MVINPLLICNQAMKKYWKSTTGHNNIPPPRKETIKTSLAYAQQTNHTSWSNMKKKGYEDNGNHTIIFTWDTHSEILHWTPNGSQHDIKGGRTPVTAHFTLSFTEYDFSRF